LLEKIQKDLGQYGSKIQEYPIEALHTTVDHQLK